MILNDYWQVKMDQQIKFSLLIGTLNRPKILSICLDKLKKQTYKKFEIIIVDQSQDNETESLVSAYSGLDIKYRRVNFKGLSKARNEAISLMSGDYFCLIDDDADYSCDYLAKAVKIFEMEPGVIISGYILDTYTDKGIVDYRRIKHADGLKLREIIRLCPSAGLVIPASTINNVGHFDERLGVGTRFGATEETDYLLRCKKAGYKIVHSESLFVQHPIYIGEKPDYNHIEVDKVKSYAMGGGALYKKHLYYGKEYDLFPLLIENFGRVFVKKIVRRTDVEKARFKGFVEGWREFKQ